MSLCWAMLAIGNAPVPILHDMVEAYAWGRQFELGYNQHPPFWAWICGAWFLVFARADWSFALLDAINAGVGLAGAWALIGDFASGSRRMAGFALLLLTPIYTLGAYKYDANTIFLSLWPWMTHAFVRAMRTRSLGWSLSFGALAAAACLSKYFAVVPLFVCGLGALATREGRDWLASASPWVAFVTAAVLCAPHVIWLLDAGAPPLRYFSTASGLALSTIGPAALVSLATDLAYLVAVVLVVWWFGRGAARGKSDHLLTMLALGPFVLTFVSGIALRVRLTPEMAIGVMGLIPLWLIAILGPTETDALARFTRRAAIVVTVAAAALSPVVMAVRAYGPGGARVAPYPEAAAEVGRLYRERFGAPLAYVAGAEYAHYVAFYGPDRAQAFYHFDYGANLWVTPERLTERGWAAVCAQADSDCTAKAQEMAGASTQRVELSASRRFLGHVAQARRIVVWLTPPRGGG